MQREVAVCPVCGRSFFHLLELQVHVNGHFDIDVDTDSTCNTNNLNGKNNCAVSHSPFSELEVTDEGNSCSYLGVSQSDDKLSKNSKQAVNGSHVPSKTHPSNGACSGSGSFHLCPICGSPFTNLSDLEKHVNGHLDEDENYFTDHKSQDSTRTDERCGTNENVDPNVRSRCPNIPESWKDNGRSCTQGVMQKIRARHNSCCRSSCQFYSCDECTHFSTFGMPDDGFGCGYRNLQMILSGLSSIPQFQSSLFQGRLFIPSVYRLQLLIEEAWSKGFDAAGAEQLNSKVVNTKKWIGATEIATVLSYLKVKCKIFDFGVRSSGPLGHPKLGECIKNYFKSSNPIKVPLYLQHQGHSKLVVGFEEKNQSTNLIVIDPGMPKYKMEEMMGVMNSNQLKRACGSLPASLLKPVSSFTKSQYQVVAVFALIENDREWQASKVLTSVKMS